MPVFLVLTQAYRNSSVRKLIAAFDRKTAIIRLNNIIFDPTTLNFQIGQRITSNTNKKPLSDIQRLRFELKRNFLIITHSEDNLYSVVF